jgi:formylglycine-generating enzyme required for sulfatase activity
MPALETTVALFDKNDVQASLSLIKILEGGAFQDRLKNGGFGPQMVWIPAGRFRMGDIQGGGSSDEKPVHEVSVDRFAMGKHEVTVGEFRQFVNATGYKTEAEKGDGCYSYKKRWRKLKEANWHNSYLSQNDNHPVVCVTWNDANAYAKWLSEETGQKYRLPTEAEWEYAARAGTLTARYWGNNPDDACGYANVHDITSKKENGFSWTPHNCTDGYAKTAPVGHFKPNNFGLFDMLGNVWEWTCSEYSSSYNGTENFCKEHAKLRVIRGGSWNYAPMSVRVTSRYRILDDFRDVLVGFRLVRP